MGVRGWGCAINRGQKVRKHTNAYLFLAAKEAGFISGIVLRVDGAFVVGT